MSLDESTPLAGVILCGGLSSRMGYPKALLPIGNECSLQRVVRRLSDCAAPIAIVAAADQELPELSSDVIIARDRRASLGPLEGIGRGLEAVRPHAERAMVTSCDAPFLSAEFVSGLAAAAAGFDLCMPVDDAYFYPLAAVYRTGLVEEIETLLREGVRRPRVLLERCRSREIAVDELRQFDPELLSLQNLNDPAAYQEAMRRLGLEIPAEIQRTLSID